MAPSHLRNSASVVSLVVPANTILWFQEGLYFASESPFEHSVIFFRRTSSDEAESARGVFGARCGRPQSSGKVGCDFNS